MAITKGKILKTALLPGYLPRLQQLIGSGFGNISFLIALVYNTVRILPDNHPFLRPEARGEYTIRQVIAEAGNHISIERKNIDQIIVFFAIIVAIIILCVQVILLLLSFLIPSASAQIPASILDFFVTPNPDEDIAFSLLNLVFGIPEFFDSTDPIAVEPIHLALQGLFEFYSYGMLVVGIFIILYMVVTTVAETAQSGIPFGRRFNKGWVPVRIVLFFMLLLPITHGINSAQYITLYAAKMGSGLASQGWVVYNWAITQNNGTLTGQQEQNIAIPKKENLMHLPSFMSVVRTCATGYDNEYIPEDWAEDNGIAPWAVYETAPNNWVAEDMLGTSYEDLSEASGGRAIYIVFGREDATEYREHLANIGPLCGTLVLPVTDVSQAGPAVIRLAYFELVRNLWLGTADFTNYTPTGEETALYEELHEHADNFMRTASSMDSDSDYDLQPPVFKNRWAAHIDNLMEGDGVNVDEGGNLGVIAEAVDAQVESNNGQVPQEVIERGWAGAGIWYNEIASQNGAFVSALRNPPIAMLYPRILEKIEKANRAENEMPDPLARFTVSFAAGSPGINIQPREKEIARATNYAFLVWNKKDGNSDPQNLKTGNAFIDMISVVLGTEGLFEMCRNVDIHPLAQLSQVGKSMLDNSIRAFGGSALFALFGVQPLFAQTTAALSSAFASIAGVGLLVGFVLFYVLPFMPFIYFFFGVGSWVKTIFEAMVAMPLWALAHLRIDGEGIMGDAAMSGYYLIFEIFIRPILVVFGLLASVIVFAAMVKILNEIFYLVVSNVSGHDPQSNAACFQGPDAEQPNPVAPPDLNETYRGPIDEFFFTILYAIIVYMIGTSCFKLIDSIPNNILRWLSADTSSFADNSGDAAEGLMKYVTLGGSQFGSQIGASLSQVGSGAKEAGKGAMASLFSE